MPVPGITSDQDPMGILGVTLRERFRIDRLVACGGFGYVYRATDLALGKSAAVKVLHNPTAALDVAALAEELAAEARRQAALDHPAVVRVIDLGVTTTPAGITAPWMALEWVEGHTIAEELRDRAGETRSPAECLAVLRPVFEALAEAHGRGIVHRDIKPSNIMVAGAEGGARRASRPATRLLDFGIAKVMAPDERRPPKGETLTRSDATAFTLRFASPEQLGGMRTGPWTDVHALALVMVHMITGKEPFPGDDVLAVMQKVLDDRRPTPARLGVDVGAVEPVMARALARNHAERYSDAGAFLDALDEALAAPAAQPPEPAPKETAPPEAPRRITPPPEVTLGEDVSVKNPRGVELGPAPKPSPLLTARHVAAAGAVAALAAALLAIVPRGSPARPAADASTATLPVIAGRADRPDAAPALVEAPGAADVVPAAAEDVSARRPPSNHGNRSARRRDAAVEAPETSVPTPAAPSAPVDAGRRPIYDPGVLTNTTRGGP